MPFCPIDLKKVLNWVSSSHECLTHWGRGNMAAMSQMIFPNTFSWMKMHEFRLKFRWSLFLIYNIPALVQIMAWRRPGDKPLSEPMMVSLLMHICVTRPQWVNHWINSCEARKIPGELKKSHHHYLKSGWEISSHSDWINMLMLRQNGCQSAISNLNLMKLLYFNPNNLICPCWFNNH